MIISHLAFITTTIGTGAITSSGTAYPGYLDITSIGSGTIVSYGIADGINWESGNGLWTGSVLRRGSIASSNSNNPISLSGSNAIVYSGPIAGLSIVSGSGISLASGTTGPGIYFGSGAPTLTVPKGSIYTDIAASASPRLYINAGGNTWFSFTSSG